MEDCRIRNISISEIRNSQNVLKSMLFFLCGIYSYMPSSIRVKMFLCTVLNCGWPVSRLLPFKFCTPLNPFRRHTGSTRESRMTVRLNGVWHISDAHQLIVIHTSPVPSPCSVDPSFLAAASWSCVVITLPGLFSRTASPITIAVISPQIEQDCQETWNLYDCQHIFRCQHTKSLVPKPPHPPPRRAVLFQCGLPLRTAHGVPCHLPSTSLIPGLSVHGGIQWSGLASPLVHSAPCPPQIM